MNEEYSITKEGVEVLKSYDFKEQLRDLVNQYLEAMDKYNAERYERVETEGTDFGDYAEPDFKTFINWLK